jgi:hypothetical protein
MAAIPTRPPPPTIDTVLGRVVELFAAVADPTPILRGKQYVREFGIGTTPSILFVPAMRGSIGPAIEMGHVASIKHGCNVLASTSDAERYLTAYSLTDRAMAALSRAAPGRIAFGEYSDAYPEDFKVPDSYGAVILFSFTFARDVWKDPQIAALPAAPATVPPYWSPAHLPTPVPAPAPATHVHSTVAVTPKE